MSRPGKFISRKEWGARPATSQQGVDPGMVTELFIHHTVTQAPIHHAQCAPLVKGIQNNHMTDQVNSDGEITRRAWSDIGYSYLCCPHGWIYEGRGFDFMTASQLGHNYQGRSLGCIGDYRKNEPSSLLLEGATEWVRWAQEELPNAETVLGHRDVNQTTCPGDVLYAWVQEQGWTEYKWTLSELRQIIQALRWIGWPWEAIKRTKWWRAFKRRGGS